LRPFSRDRDGTLAAAFDDEEVQVLISITGELIGILAPAAEAASTQLGLKVRRRLLPDAYAEDPEAAAEFRRFTEPDLLARKSQNAEVLQSSLTKGSRRRERLAIRLDAAETQSWLRCLTDLRLTLATALDIFEDGDEGSVTPENEYSLAIYHWLGYVQESILEALES
jgi:hypothetical protein